MTISDASAALYGSVAMMDCVIRGRLGLKEWISEALSPVARENEDVPEYLWAGYHPNRKANYQSG
jgi:hypothetical protein